MLIGVNSMFDNMQEMLKRLKKKNFEENSKQFWRTYMNYFFEMTDYVGAATDKEAAAKTVAPVFPDEVEAKFASGAKKKISGSVQTDINFFMIYYVFPSLLKTQHDDCRLIADSICAEWKSRFKNSDIGYTDYEALYGSFKEKIFGIF